jgi:Tfp pilus assembly protein PilN
MAPEAASHDFLDLNFLPGLLLVSITAALGSVTPPDDFIDINILPEQYRPRELPRRVIALSLVAAMLAILIVPLYFVSASMRGDAASLEAEIQSVQDDLAKVNTPAPEVQELMDNLASTQEVANKLEETHSTIAADRADWPAVMAAISDYNPDQLTLDSLAQTDSTITLKGQAVEKSAVDAYANDLEKTGVFASVNIQSISAIPTPFITATVTPGVTLTPTKAITPTKTITPTAPITPTVTATPIPGPDEYEIDDFQAKDIILGQTQLHSFHPVYDVDKVKFLAKAGRHYRVSTSGLAPGVDTILEVNVGGDRPTNDDCYPGTGDLSSCVEFEVRSGADVEASIKISNRGQFGPEMKYQVTLEEISPTPTPVPTDTPIPTNTPPPTATPEPTATSTPSVTPTPTPDLRDVYEPDDPLAQPIGVGDTQTHSFYPDNDVDWVTFGVKEGRSYALTTSSMASGVDTEISIAVEAEDEVTYYTNDDIADGFYESEVRFLPTADGTAKAQITNAKGSQYGADKTYDLTLQLLSSLVDQYEPDDPFAKPINVGEVQEHNYYPEGDRDLVKFLAKEGQGYAIFTANLATGVDTYLKVMMGDEIIGENDDWQAHAFESAVCAEAIPFKGVVTVLVTNQQQTYEPDQTYEIGLCEQPILQVNTRALKFAAEQAQGVTPQKIQLENIGGECPHYWKGGTDVGWLELNPSSGSMPATVNVSLFSTDLPVGTHHAAITITATSPCVGNTPWMIDVELEIRPEQETSSPLRPPGLASLGLVLSPAEGAGSALAAPPYHLQTMGVLPTRGDRMASGLLSPEPVEFVIVLQLKTGAPESP